VRLPLRHPDRPCSKADGGGPEITGGILWLKYLSSHSLTHARGPTGGGFVDVWYLLYRRSLFSSMSAIGRVRPLAGQTIGRAAGSVRL